MTIDIKAVAFTKAIKTLDALGCKYKIIDAEGNEHGVLELAKPAVEKPKRNNFAQYYMEPLKAMQIGQTVTFAPPEPGLAEAMRSALAGSAVNVFGPGNVMTHVENDLIHAFRRG